MPREAKRCVGAQSAVDRKKDIASPVPQSGAIDQLQSPEDSRCPVRILQ